MFRLSIMLYLYIWYKYEFIIKYQRVNRYPIRKIYTCRRRYHYAGLIFNRAEYYAYVLLIMHKEADSHWFLLPLMLWFFLYICFLGKLVYDASKSEGWSDICFGREVQRRLLGWVLGWGMQWSVLPLAMLAGQKIPHSCLFRLYYLKNGWRSPIKNGWGRGSWKGYRLYSIIIPKRTAAAFIARDLIWPSLTDTTISTSSWLPNLKNGTWLSFATL